MIANMEIDGRIQMKSYLSGDPDLVVGLNQDLAIGKAGNRERQPSSLSLFCVTRAACVLRSAPDHVCWQCTARS